MLTRLRVLCCAFVLLVAAGAAGCQAKPATQASGAPVTLVITLANGGVSPNAEVIHVGVGATVTMKITTDRDDIIHVHGFDMEVPVKAGTTTEKSFVANAIGRVEVETHSPTKTVAYLDIA